MCRAGPEHRTVQRVAAQPGDGVGGSTVAAVLAVRPRPSRVTRCLPQWGLVRPGMMELLWLGGACTRVPRGGMVLRPGNVEASP